MGFISREEVEDVRVLGLSIRDIVDTKEDLVDLGVSEESVEELTEESVEESV